MAKKILVVTPYERDANSFWRCMGPLTYLSKYSDGEIEIQLADSQKGIAWPEVMKYDLIFMHRPCRQDDVTVMQIAHNLGVPVWIDYDDWLFELPGWNPAASVYHNPGVQNIMAQCLACADVISVSTHELYLQFKKVNPNVVILPNAYRSDLFKYRQPELEPRMPVALWRGTATHDGDLLSVKEGFKGLKEKIIFMGGPSWMLLSSMDPQSYAILGAQDVMLFQKYLYDQRPKVMVFPLVDCLFNRCKSNIAYIEAMHAGALCVAPDMPEWHRQGVITYTPHDSDAFRAAVNSALETPWDLHQEILTPAFESMKNSYDITVVNELRKHLVKELTSPFFVKTTANPFDQLTALSAMAKLRGKPEGAQPPNDQL